MPAVDFSEKIPNNVDLSNDKRLQRALEAWQPNYLEWWNSMGPTDFNQNEVYLRTAVDVGADGWAKFGYVRMPEYRWGILLAPREENRTIGFGDHLGETAWQQVPGEYRNWMKRLIVTQADTEPASVEQQRLLGHTAPSLYDLRNLFQVNVEEGRHLWAMVYLLHSYFGKDGREEAEELLARRSGNADHPRILTTFNEPCAEWLSFFCFATFTDRDGKYQLLSLAESGFDPLSRTCRFMLTEEAHHLFVGQTGLGRVIEKTCQVMKQFPDRDPREQGAIPLDVIQRFIYYWASSSLDLFGAEVSSNSANFFRSGLKGRAHEEKLDEHKALEGVYRLTNFVDGRLTNEEVPLRNAMNEILRDAYIDENLKSVQYWNRVCERNQIDFRFRYPHRRFNRTIGVYSAGRFEPLEGEPVDDATWNRKVSEWMPTEQDRTFVKSLMKPCLERGKYASWISAPPKGINDQPVDYEYVKLA